MTQNCLICDSATELLDVVDFNKNCEEARGVFLELSGLPIYYSICNSCNFTSCETTFTWSEQEFIEKIYNDEYKKIDPDYISARPLNNAKFINEMFAESQEKIRHLDYGGGNGVLSGHLRDHGWNSISYDPFHEKYPSLDTLGQFDLITAFEVFEHVPNPNQLMNNLDRLLTKNGLIIFSTLISDNHLKKGSRINWWYCSPRNGHVSLFSNRSLHLIAKKYAFNFEIH